MLKKMLTVLATIVLAMVTVLVANACCPKPELISYKVRVTNDNTPIYELVFPDIESLSSGIKKSGKTAKAKTYEVNYEMLDGDNVYVVCSQEVRGDYEKFYLNVADLEIVENESYPPEKGFKVDEMQYFVMNPAGVKMHKAPTFGSEVVRTVPKGVTLTSNIVEINPHQDNDAWVVPAGWFYTTWMLKSGWVYNDEYVPSYANHYEDRFPSVLPVMANGEKTSVFTTADTVGYDGNHKPACIIPAGEILESNAFSNTYDLAKVHWKNKDVYVEYGYTNRAVSFGRAIDNHPKSITAWKKTEIRLYDKTEDGKFSGKITVNKHEVLDWKYCAIRPDRADTECYYFEKDGKSGWASYLPEEIISFCKGENLLENAYISMEEGTELHEEPRSDAKVCGTLSRDTQVEALYDCVEEHWNASTSETDYTRWYYVRHGKTAGWLCSNQFDYSIKHNYESTAKVGYRLYSGPWDDAKWTGVAVPKGASVTVIYENVNGWDKISYNGKTGWHYYAVVKEEESNEWSPEGESLPDRLPEEETADEVSEDEIYEVPTESSMAVWQIVLLCVGGAAALAGIAVLVIFLVRKKKRA